MFDDFSYLPLFRENLVTGIEEPELDLIDVVNYPNPATGSTQITFNALGGHVDLSIYALNGQKVNTLVDKTLTKGQHTINYNTTELRQGMYIIKVRNEGNHSSRKLVVNR